MPKAAESTDALEPIAECGCGAHDGEGRKALGVDPEAKMRNLHRLRRIEGQVRGLQKMIEEDRYCIDVLTQLRAVRAALSRVETEMLKAHLGHCIEAAIVGGDQAEQRQKASELIELLDRAAR